MSETLLQENYTCHHLPTMPTKVEITRHFQYTNTYWFFTRVFFDKILPGTSFTYDDIRNSRRLPPELAKELYNHYKITELKN